MGIAAAARSLLAMSEATRFRFDFADLQPPAVDLKVLQGGVPVPAQAVAVTAHPRPGWLRPLLPIFAEGQGLRVEVARPAAPTFAGLLLDGLAGLFVVAGAGNGVAVARWEHGFLVGSHGLARMPVDAHFTLVAADLVPHSLELARGYLGLLPAERTLLRGKALLGRAPGRAVGAHDPCHIPEARAREDDLDDNVAEFTGDERDRDEQERQHQDDRRHRRGDDRARPPHHEARARSMTEKSRRPISCRLPWNASRQCGRGHRRVNARRSTSRAAGTASFGSRTMSRAILKRQG